jgi:DNA repair exonuclease SbcCD ATPase subunit
MTQMNVGIMFGKKQTTRIDIADESKFSQGSLRKVANMSSPKDKLKEILSKISGEDQQVIESAIGELVESIKASLAKEGTLSEGSGEISEKIERLASQRDELVARAHNAEEKLREAVSEISELNEENESLKSDIAEIETLKSERDSLREQLEQIEEKLSEQYEEELEEKFKSKIDKIGDFIEMKIGDMRGQIREEVMRDPSNNDRAILFSKIASIVQEHTASATGASSINESLATTDREELTMLRAQSRLLEAQNTRLREELREASSCVNPKSTLVPNWILEKTKLDNAKKLVKEFNDTGEILDKRDEENICEHPEVALEYAQAIVKKGLKVPDCVTKAAAKAKADKVNEAASCVNPKSTLVPNWILEKTKLDNAKKLVKEFNDTGEILDKRDEENICEHPEVALEYAQAIVKKGLKVPDCVTKAAAKAKADKVNEAAELDKHFSKKGLDGKPVSGGENPDLEKVKDIEKVMGQSVGLDGKTKFTEKGMDGKPVNESRRSRASELLKESLGQIDSDTDEKPHWIGESKQGRIERSSKVDPIGIPFGLDDIIKEVVTGKKESESQSSKAVRGTDMQIDEALKLAGISQED